jgi:ribose 5-phosphate isomerase A
MTNLDADAQKRLAAVHAADFVQDGMRVGLGTGSTAAHLVHELGERWRQGLRFTAVATSVATERLAQDNSITISALDEVTVLDIALDGADEVDPRLDLVKGLGGALLREKLVEVTATRLVILVDESKEVTRLGERARVPVEVVPFGWGHTAARLKNLGLVPALRGSDKPFITDGGHFILDCQFGPCDDVAALAHAIKSTSGVVEHGFFLGMATDLIVGRSDGSVTTRQQER